VAPVATSANPQPDPGFRRVVAGLLGVTPDELEFAPLAGGVSSDIWRVESRDTVYCAKRALPRLKVKELWEAPVSRNAEEVRWLRTVRAWIGDQAAAVVAHDERAGVALLRWYDPSEWRNWKTELLAGRVDLRVANALGRALATIARAAMQENVRPALAAGFDNAALFDALRIDPFFRHIRDRHPALRALVAELETTRTTLVHGDFSPKNVLVSEAGEIRILDAETATWGAAGFDPGYLLAHLLLKYEHLGNAALLAAAKRFWSAYQETAGALDPEFPAQTCRVLLGMLLARIDGKSPVEYLADSSREGLRRAVLHLLDLELPRDPGALLEDWPRLRSLADA
jgi:aminoglycoside phosphotransferase (APT) family kinase protein